MTHYREAVNTTTGKVMFEILRTQDRDQSGELPTYRTIAYTQYCSRPIVLMADGETPFPYLLVIVAVALVLEVG